MNCENQNTARRKISDCQKFLFQMSTRLDIYGERFIIGARIMLSFTTVELA